MPRQSKQDIKPEAKLVREEVNGEAYDVLYINEKEIVAFHLKNIELLKMEHTNQSMLEAVRLLLTNA